MCRTTGWFRYICEEGNISLDIGIFHLKFLQIAPIVDECILASSLSGPGNIKGAVSVGAGDVTLEVESMWVTPQSWSPRGCSSVYG